MSSILALAVLVTQDGTEQARKLLDEVVEAMKDASVLKFDVDQVRGRTSQGETTCYLKRPNQARFELGSLLVIFDGEFQWTYWSGRKTYSKRPVKGVPPYKGYGPIYDLYLNKSSDALFSMKREVSVRKTKVGKATYDVVLWNNEFGESRLWIDHKKRIFRFEDPWLVGDKVQYSTSTFSQYDLSPRVPDNFFEFRPPKGVKEEE